jgi:hypothetical protein
MIKFAFFLFYTPEQQQQQPYSQTNEEEPYYISKTNNPYTFYDPDKSLLRVHKSCKQNYISIPLYDQVCFFPVCKVLFLFYRLKLSFHKLLNKYLDVVLITSNPWKKEDYCKV